MADESPMLSGLRDRTTSIKVVDCDHRRVRGGLAVETDYIVQIRSPGHTYRISKTFHNFRSFCEQIKAYPETATIRKLVEQQKISYLGKVNYVFVTLLAKSRREILQNVLNLLVHDFASYPDDLARIVEVFLLTDVVQEEECVGQENSNPIISDPSLTPLSVRRRKPKTQRELEHERLHDCMDTLFVEEEESRRQKPYLPSYKYPEPTVWTSRTKLGIFVDTNPFLFIAIMAVCCRFLMSASMIVIHVDLDIFLLIVFGCFCLGIHTPRPLVGGFDRPAMIKAAAVSSHSLLRRSLLLSPRNDESLEPVPEYELLTLPEFPSDATIGSIPNCWSKPNPSRFLVRGPTYLSDHVKVPSQDYLFQPRGLDLFLTDDAPENVGRNSHLLAGKLRDKATCIINFRLPWGVLIMYGEIPERFLSFLESKCNIPESFTPPERNLALWLMNSPAQRNQMLKIVPSVVDGPWVVKSVVGGKPALIGKKVPINYVYQPAQAEKKCAYLELDLDIAASSAARGILSVARSYTNVLTLDLGFVIQGCEHLPEQMLMGVTLHGIDPLTAAPLPHDDSIPYLTAAPSSDDESV